MNPLKAHESEISRGGAEARRGRAPFSAVSASPRDPAVRFITGDQVRTACLFAGLLFGTGTATWPASAQPVPMMINYQGRLAIAEGSPFPTADYALTVQLFDAPVGGTLVWGPQTFDGGLGAGHGAKVPVVQGHFNVVLGPVDTAGRSLTSAFTASNRFVEITVSNRLPILPRQQILSTPYAIQAGNGSPPGAISAFGGSTVPDGWLLCDGRGVTSDQYPRLWAAIGTSWGGSGPAGFNLPDLRGLFLRGVDNSRDHGPSGQDPDAANRQPIKTGGNPGNAVGSFQLDAFASHDHEVLPRLSGYDPAQGNWLQGTANKPASYGSAMTGPRGGSETRPRNAYVNYIIKY